MKEIFRAAFVIARRDFTAIIYSKAFIFFLLGHFSRCSLAFAQANLAADRKGSVATRCRHCDGKADSDKIPRCP